MPSISNLTLNNASIVNSGSNYIDFNIWLLLIVCSIVLLLISRLKIFDSLEAQIIVSAISVIGAISALWSSLSVSSTTMMAVGRVVVNSTTTETIVPVVNNISSTSLTYFCAVVLVLAILNGVDLVIRYLQQLTNSEFERENLEFQRRSKNEFGFRRL